MNKNLYPLVICYIAIENGPVEIVDFPIKNGGSFHSYVKLPEGKPPFSYGFPMVFPMALPMVDGAIILAILERSLPGETSERRRPQGVARLRQLVDGLVIPWYLPMIY